MAQTSADSCKITNIIIPKDIFDLLTGIFKKDVVPDTTDSDGQKINQSSKSASVTLLPVVNFSPVTRWAFVGLLSGNYYLNKKNNTHMSTTDCMAIYTIQNQLILTLKHSIWTNNNRFNLVGDCRFMRYPSFTFGLGSNSNFENKVLIDYKYLRIYQTAYRKVFKSLYLGFGYRIDAHYDVKELSDIVSDFDLYIEGNQEKTIAAGPTANILYDSRENALNPVGGSTYGYLSYRCNTLLTGSSNRWHSIILDVRKYVKIPAKNTNVLAFWSYNWFTFGGDPAYLDLPSTGWDASDSQGRGYIQGRFRSNNLISLETEYRFSVTRNKVLGGVVFSNVQSVSKMKTLIFEKVYPSAGVGIRLKINKYSNTNLSVDYAVGIKGSRSIFFNLGEIF